MTKRKKRSNETPQKRKKRNRNRPHKRESKPAAPAFHPQLREMSDLAQTRRALEKLLGEQATLETELAKAKKGAKRTGRVFGWWWGVSFGLGVWTGRARRS